MGSESTDFGYSKGRIGRKVYKCVMIFSQQLGCEVGELNVQRDHATLVGKGATEIIGIGLDGMI